MSNSPLASFTRISPNSTRPRNNKILKITPHHCAGVMTAEQIANVFAPTSRQASSNYVIGNDGKVGLVVDEANRAWTSSSSANDNQAVTIEVSNSSTGGDWPVSAAAWNSLVKLCADICKRNGIKSLNWTGNANGNLTVHKFFAATACPGPYLMARMPQLAQEVNALLAPAPAPAPAPTPAPEPTPAPAPAPLKVGDTVVPTALVDYNGTKLVQYDKTYTISELRGDRAVLMARGAIWAAMNTNNIRKA